MMMKICFYFYSIMNESMGREDADRLLQDLINEMSKNCYLGTVSMDMLSVPGQSVSFSGDIMKQKFILKQVAFI